MDHVSGGQPFVAKAADHNAVAEMLAWWHRHRGALLLPQQFAGRDHDVVPILNETGARDQFDIVGLNDPLFDFDTEDARERSVLRNATPLIAAVPSPPTHIGRFAVLLKPAKDGEVVPALVAGMVLANLQVTDASHQFADIYDVGDSTDGGESPYRLVSRDFGGAEIIRKDSGTGDKLAIVRLGALGTPKRQFQLKEPLAKYGEALAYLRLDETASAIEFTVHETDGIFTGEGEDEDWYGENGRAEWHQQNRRWEVYQMNCERDEPKE